MTGMTEDEDDLKPLPPPPVRALQWVIVWLVMAGILLVLATS